MSQHKTNSSNRSPMFYPFLNWIVPYVNVFFFFVLQIAHAIKSCCLAEIFMEKLTNMDKRTQ
jgi:hypothetical protein